MITRANISIIVLAVLGVAILAVAPIYYAYYLERRAVTSLQGATANPMVTGDAASRIIAGVSGFEKIPKDETPTVILVTDASMLGALGSVRKMDYVLLYQKAGLAVVYDEVTNHVINAVPVNIKNPNAK